MIQKVKTIANIGMEGYKVIVEADSNKSLPTIDIVGLPDKTIKESKERIRATFRNVGVDLPRRKIILNLSPSDIKKNGTRYDLPMAVAVLFLSLDSDLDKSRLEDSLFFGELGLDGSVKRVKGLLSSVISGMKKGYKNFFVPEENVHELEYIENINIYSISHFKQLVDYFGKDKKDSINVIKGGTTDKIREKNKFENFQVDFADIKGHSFAKQALAVAAGGLHNVLLVGPPGSGKTMLAKAIQSILPPMSFDDVLEVSRIYSLIGKLNKSRPLVFKRPFRSVHHTASKVSIIGGSQKLTPGEVSLAHKGVLFFDEMPEFSRRVLEVLRQPLEDRKVTISRVTGTVDYPAHFMFIGSMNPCKCGFYKDSKKQCTCSLNSVKRYQSKISGPMLDRFDMVLEVPRQNVDKIMDKSKGESSKDIRQKVNNAWKAQTERFKDTDINTNSEMSANQIEKYVDLSNNAENFLKQSVKSLDLSPRIIHRMIKLARTIGDLEGVGKILQEQQIAQALQYRSKSMFVKG